MQLIFVSGLSGAGKTVALQMLEDLDFYCIDNIPGRDCCEPSCDTPWKPRTRRSPGRRSASTPATAPATSTAYPSYSRSLRSLDIDFDVIFIHADVDVLLSRYRETRRKHPLSGAGRDLRDAIAEETAILDPVAREADYVIDSSRTSVHELRELIRARVDRDPDSGHGNVAANRVLRIQERHPGRRRLRLRRSLPAEPPLGKIAPRALGPRPAGGRLPGRPGGRRTSMYDDIVRFLEDWLPRFAANNRSYLTDRHRLHGRPTPIGLHDPTPRPPLRRQNPQRHLPTHRTQVTRPRLVQRTCRSQSVRPSRMSQSVRPSRMSQSVRPSREPHVPGKRH